MEKKIALLRGINVGGKRKILMADLKLLFENEGFTNIKTYIQSGNVVFSSDKNCTNFELENKISKLIFDKYGYDVPVVIRTESEMQETNDNNPFLKESNPDINKLLIAFLKSTPSAENCKITESHSFDPDKFVITDNCVYLYYENKIHLSKLTTNFLERKLKVDVTSRNLKTVFKLLELSQ